MKDPRNPNKITYSLPELILTGMLLFLFKLGSRRQIDYLFNTPEFLSHLAHLSGATPDRVPHNDTLAYMCDRLDPGQLPRVRTSMIRSLHRARCLEYAKLMNTYWTVAVDATGQVCYDKPHCPHCLTATIHGKTIYYHNVLEAKLVTTDGFALSMQSEFIENIDPKATKQDCERSAFRRLAASLKKDFPQLPICLLADSLYAARPVFDIARKNSWRLIITFKEGSIPELFAEFETLKSLSPENSATENYEKTTQRFAWVNDLDYHGHNLSVLECVETNKKKNKTTRFVWITNMEVNDSNYRLIAKGGRTRWKIENQGFNTQKNGGYELAHPYCSHHTGAKNFYLLLQIAHIVNQLMEKGSALRRLIKHTFGSIRNIALFMLEAFRTCRLDIEALESELAKPFQIRFTSYFDSS